MKICPDGRSFFLKNSLPSVYFFFFTKIANGLNSFTLACYQKILETKITQTSNFPVTNNFPPPWSSLPLHNLSYPRTGPLKSRSKNIHLQLYQNPHPQQLTSSQPIVFGLGEIGTGGGGLDGGWGVGGGGSPIIFGVDSGVDGVDGGDDGRLMIFALSLFLSLSYAVLGGGGSFVFKA